MLRYNKKLKPLSQKLRYSMTDTERLLWSQLRGKQLKCLQFYRQKIIGNYIVDFYRAKAGLVIEADGGQHYTEAGRSVDDERNHHLQSLGLHILNYPDSDVLTDINGVVQSIYGCIRSPSPPFPKGEFFWQNSEIRPQTAFCMCMVQKARRAFFHFALCTFHFAF